MDIKERVITTASNLFRENGIKSVTMDIIAETLGISKRTLYENFKDKNDLVNECYTYGLKLHEKLDEEITKTTSNVIEAMLKYYLIGMEEMRRCNKNYVADLRKYYPEVFERVCKHREVIFREKVIIALDKGILDGLVRPDINTEIVSIMMKEQLYIIEEEISELKKFDLLEVYETLFKSFVRGIATQKGLELIDNVIDCKDNLEKIV
ncbi:MAG: TetR/AcrR family transcriptional regulator [Candidatus Azobacteroides sp.]|nr:TetR/AcrR family transcriptional regulator [Candidatus Azobacteroides sp.]